jgi:hypothetical protein
MAEEDEKDGQKFDAQCLLTQMWYNKFKPMQWNPKGGIHGLGHVKLLKGNSELLINKLTGNPEQWNAFSEIKSRQVAFLTPKIRLWKVKGTGEAERDVEFFFEKGSYNFQSALGKMQSIFASKDTRGTDVGIESVDVEFLAQQPAEVSNHISVKLKLFFQNFDSLMKERVGGKGETYHYSDLILRPHTKGDVKEGGGKKACIAASGLYVPQDYKIKLEIGWNDPQFGSYVSSKVASSQAGLIMKGANMLVGTSGSPSHMPSAAALGSMGFKEDSKLRKVMRASGTLMQLTLKNHTFNFAMDGSFTLDIEYHAWMKAGMAGPASNIFFNKGRSRNGGPPRDLLKEKIESIKKREKAKKKRKAATTPPGSSPKPKNPDEDEENEQEQISNSEMLKSKIVAYRRIFSAIEKGAQAMAVPKEAIGALTSGAGSEFGSAMQCAEFRNIIRATAMGGHLESRSDAKEQKTKLSTRLAEETAEDKPDLKKLAEDEDETTELGEADVSDQMEAKAKAAGYSSGDFVQFHFVYFGHIIDTVYNVLASEANPRARKWNEDMKHIRFVLGPAIAEDPCEGFNPKKASLFGVTAAMVKEAVESPCGGPTAKYIKGLELYNMPVLWEQFAIWFKNNVIKQQKESYNFRTFLEDIYNSLLLPSLGSNCNARIKNAPPRLEFSILDLGELPANSPVLKKNYLDAGRIPISKIGSLLKTARMRKSGNKSSVSTNKSFSLVVMFMSPRSTSRRKTKTQDQNDGVYWIELGKGNGAIIDYSFSKNDAPYLAEAKTLGSGALGADLAGGAIYNFSCEMLGNGFFKPGQLIYVDPRQLQRTGKSKVSIGELRLGGYYVVDSVKISIKNGEFITSIEATWSGPGISGGSKSTVAHLRSPAEKNAAEQEVTRIAGKGMSKYIYNSGGAKSKT